MATAKEIFDHKSKYGCSTQQSREDLARKELLEFTDQANSIQELKQIIRILIKHAKIK